jgi:geranylgeranyl diphosphate synthase type II
MTVPDILDLIEKEIARQTYGTEPRSLYEPIRYIMGLGGKRIRPLLTCLGYSVFSSDVEKIIPAAVCVEAFHNFTLMHDDIMDRAPLRRGKPTVHTKWDTPTAILSGDVMLVKVYEMLLERLPSENAAEALKIFNRTAIEVCEGQQLDMEFERMAKVTEAKYIDMIRLKTAALLGFSLELGALLARASTADREALNRFGVNMGIGFQLHDDYLDVYAEGKKFGKQVGGDILSNKKTFLLIKAIELAKGKTATNLQKWLKAKTFVKSKKIKAVTSIYDELDVPALTKGRMQGFFDKAVADLATVKGNKEALTQFAEGLMSRRH